MGLANRELMHLLRVSLRPVSSGVWRGSRRLSALALTLTLGAGACAESVGEQDRGDIIHQWDEPPEEVAELAVALGERELFEGLARDFDARYGLPRDLPVIHKQCGAATAYYAGSGKEITLCYELLQVVADVARESKAFSEPEILDRVRATWLFFFFHELGHALIDLYDLPVAGKEEDTVDTFSTLVLIRLGGTEMAALAASYWRARMPASYDNIAYADEHALSAQRFYWTLCLVYGSDPDGNQDMVTNGLLTQVRADRCKGDYALASHSWDELLAPWKL